MVDRCLVPPEEGAEDGQAACAHQRSVLRWAREEIGLTEAAFAEAVRAEPAEVVAWEAGEASPSKGAFTKIVDVLKRPSAVFFLPRPPVAAGLRCR